MNTQLFSKHSMSSYFSLGKVLVLFIIILASLTVNYLQAAWTPPSAGFPDGNVDIPINIGANVQVKSGGTIGVDTLITNDIEVGSDAVADVATMVADFNGSIGAAEYCDENGENCTAAADVGSGGIGSVTTRSCTGSGNSSNASCNVSCLAGEVRTGCSINYGNNDAAAGAYPGAGESCTCRQFQPDSGSITCYSYCAASESTF